MSDERINSFKMSNHSITPNLTCYHTKIRVEFNESCLKQDKIKFKHGKVVNIYIVCETCKNINISEWLTLTLTYHYLLMVKKFKNLKQKILRL